MFFGARVAERAADGLLALEKNWDGPLAANGARRRHARVVAAARARGAGPAGNWRWQMCLLRAYYDAYTRHRLLRETRLEAEAPALAAAPRSAPRAAMDARRAILAARAVRRCCLARAHRSTICASALRVDRLQTSVPKYSASGAERGAVLDFVDYPLNNRWWLEDEFAEVRALPDEAARSPVSHDRGPGLARAPAASTTTSATSAVAARAAGADEPETRRTRGWPSPHFTWEDGAEPQAPVVAGEPALARGAGLRAPRSDATYTLRLHVITNTAAGQVRPRIDGEAAAGDEHRRRHR